MAERTSHAPGTFSWADLSTTDTDGRQGLLHRPCSAGTPTTTRSPRAASTRCCSKGGKPVGALSAIQNEGQPPAWNSYVTVESADDAAAAAAEENGGTVVMEAFDVMDVGRMAIVQDPTGAFLCRLGAARQHRRGAGQRDGRADHQPAQHERPAARAGVLRGRLRLAHRAGRGRRHAVLGHLQRRPGQRRA